MTKKVKVDFWQPAIFLITLFGLVYGIYTSATSEDIKLFSINLLITGIVAVYVYFGLRPKIS